MSYANFITKPSHAEANAAADANHKVTALFPEEQCAGKPVDKALELFNEMSRQITDSYRTLESRVNQLSGELSAESMQRQQELEEKERLADRLSTLLDVMPAGVVVLDSQGVVSQCNPAARELLGEPLEGQRWLEIIRRSFAPRSDDGHEVSLRDGRRVGIEIRSMENEPGQLILLTDLTETRQLQTQLAHAQRLSAMGRMVASLAHQIRTPLSAAMLYGGHLLNDELDEELHKRCATRLMSRLNHLEQQVRDMLVFARGETRVAEELSVDEFGEGLEQALEGLNENLRGRVSCSRIGSDRVLLANRDALIGACMNLVNNALEAGATEVSVNLEPQRRSLELVIADNGPGFKPSDSERIMEAFYTTKSHGTGLGLAVVQAVVKAHRGEFSLACPARDGESGAVATLRLPLMNTASASASASH